MTVIDWNKPVQTKDGRKFHHLGRVPNARYPIAGYVEGEVTVEQWNEEGRYYMDGMHSSELDLINVPEKRGFWVNVWKGPDGAEFLSSFFTEKAAEYDAVRPSGCKLIARIRREFEEGEGLS